MSEDLIARLISAGISLGIVFLIGFVTYLALRVKKDIPRLITLLPTDIQKTLEEVAKRAAEYIELMDANGQLRAKGEEKLNLAVDYAVQYIEGVLKTNGLEIDIDQEEIKKAIQKYVWQNPDLFPSGEGTTALIPQKKDADSGRSLT